MYLVSEYKIYFYEAKERVKMWGLFQTLCLIQTSFIFYDRISISCVLCSLKSLKIQENMKFQFRKQVTSKTSFNIACLSSRDFISHLAIYRKIKGRKDTVIFKWNKNWYFSWWNKKLFHSMIMLSNNQCHNRKYHWAYSNEKDKIPFKSPICTNKRVKSM